MSHDDALLDRLRLFHGDVTESAARVVADVEGLSAEDGWELRGSIGGPYSSRARTLPTQTSFRPAKGAGVVAAEALLLDPCPWTPEAPLLYEAHIALHRQGREVAAVKRTWGLRQLGAFGRDWRREGKRWVLRAIRQSSVSDFNMAAWRATGAAMVVDGLDEELYESASREGLLLVVRLDAHETALGEQLSRAARWPAVAFIVLDHRADEGSELRRLAPNTLLLESMRSLDQAQAAWAHGILLDREAINSETKKLAGRRAPIVVSRPLGSCESLSAARAAVDRLQADLAPIGDFAGYVV